MGLLKEVLKMNSSIHTVKLKQSNMLCNRCLTNVVKALSLIEGIQELNVDLDKKLISVTYENDKFSKKTVIKMINDSIVCGKVDNKIYIQKDNQVDMAEDPVCGMYVNPEIAIKTKYLWKNILLLQ